MKTKGVRYWDNKLIGTGGILNEYVKYRDAVDFTPEGKPIAHCITCNKLVSSYNLHAGHWVSRNHKGAAYDEHNVHAQCGRPCNKDNKGEPIKYEQALIKKYGQEEVDRLRGWVYQTRKWTPMELEELYYYYKEQLKQYK